MKTDLVVNLFGADMRRLLDIARAADQAGFGAVWTNDHFSGTMVGASWSRDPFVAMSALATVTSRIDIGLLVANIVNRHPVQLASAISSVQSLAPGRVRLGVGSGAVPGSRFAIEHDMIGIGLGDFDRRRDHLRDYVAALRAIWAGEPEFQSSHVNFRELSGIVDGDDMPQMILGSSGWSTIEVALDVADGVNIRRTTQLGAQLERIAEHQPADHFEISVLDAFDSFDVDHPTGGASDDLRTAGVHRRIVMVSADVDLGALERLGGRLAENDAEEISGS